ncbi:MAG: response regulator [Pseudomonadota bacterium]
MAGVMAQRVLLAEDEPNIVESLRFLLERAGYAVDVRDTGTAALETVLTDPPDLLILDVMLPEVDGFEILRQVRGSKSAATVPVLMLTAKGQREDRERAMSCGADLFISKPFGNSELIEAVGKLVGQTGSSAAPAGAGASLPAE